MRTGPRRFAVLAVVAAALMIFSAPDRAAAAASHSSSPIPPPPVARKIPMEIVTHGDKRIDDYFWLREKTNAAVSAYLNAENAFADAVMRPHQKFEDALYREILGHLKETDTSAPVRHGDYFYYSRTEKGKSYPIQCRKLKSLRAGEEIVFDQNPLAAGLKFFSVGAAVPSDDNNLLAYTTDTTGYRQFTLQIKDLRTGKLLADKFERVDEVVWATDNKTIFFVTEDETTKRQDSFYRHALGSAATARIYFEPDELFDLSVERSRDRAYVFLTAESKLSTEVRFIRADRPESALQMVQLREADHKYFVTHGQGRFYLRTNDKAKNYRVATAPVETPGKKHWTEFIAHNPAVKIDEIDLFRNHAAVSERENGLERIRILDLTTKASHDIALPEPTYELGVDNNPEFDTATLRFRYQSLVTPNSFFDYDQ